MIIIVVRPFRDKSYHSYLITKYLGIMMFIPEFDTITVLPNGHRYLFIYGPEKERIELFQH